MYVELKDCNINLSKILFIQKADYFNNEFDLKIVFLGDYIEFEFETIEERDKYYKILQEKIKEFEKKCIYK